MFATTAVSSGEPPRRRHPEVRSPAKTAIVASACHGSRKGIRTGGTVVLQIQSVDPCGLTVTRITCVHGSHHSGYAATANHHQMSLYGHVSGPSLPIHH